MQEFLATGKVLYVLAGLCLLSMVCKWMTKSLYKRLMKETTNMAMTKNKNLKTLKQRIESTYRLNGGVANMAAYLERQAADFKFMKISLSGWSNFCKQLTLLCFLVGGGAAFLAYWYRSDTYYIALYGTMGILAGLLTMVVDVGVNLGEKRQQLLVALEDYMDNSLFFRPGKGRMAAAETEDGTGRMSAVRSRENSSAGRFKGECGSPGQQSEGRRTSGRTAPAPEKGGQAAGAGRRYRLVKTQPGADRCQPGQGPVRRKLAEGLKTGGGEAVGRYYQRIFDVNIRIFTLNEGKLWYNKAELLNIL